MERMTLNAAVREDTGKGTARSLRREGSIPAVVYRKNKGTKLSFNTRELVHFIRATSGEQVLVNLNIDGKKKLALLKDYQVDPVAGNLLHADFFEVSMKEKVKVSVHIITVGEPIGVKRDKGILQHVLREIEVECLPADIPGQVEIDITELLTGDSVHVSDLTLPDKVLVLTDPSEVIAGVVAPKIEVVEEEEEEVAEEAAEEGAEPEVAKKGKAEEPEKEREKEGEKEGEKKKKEGA